MPAAVSLADLLKEATDAVPIVRGPGQATCLTE